MRAKVRILSALVIAGWSICGCASTHLVSEQELAAMVSKIKLGETTAADGERILGTDHGSDPRFWVYNFSDSSFGLVERKTGFLSGAMPVVPATAPTDTKAVVVVRLTEAGVVEGLEVSRFYSAPYTGDYWFLVRGSAPDVLQSVARLGEAAGLRVEALDNEAHILTLGDAGSKAKMTVKLEPPTLHFASTIPYDRESNEYRVFVKQEVALRDRLLQSKIVQ